MPRLPAVEGCAIFDILLRFGAFLRRVLFRETVWTRGVFFAPSWSFSLGSPCASAFLMLFVEESAPDKGANFFVVRNADFYKAANSALKADSPRRRLSPCLLRRLPRGGACDSRPRSTLATEHGL